MDNGQGTVDTLPAESELPTDDTDAHSAGFARNPMTRGHGDAVKEFISNLR